MLYNEDYVVSFAEGIDIIFMGTSDETFTTSPFPSSQGGAEGY